MVDTGLKAAYEEVLELADKMATAVPEGTRPLLVLNALKHMLQASVIGLAESEDRARDTMKLIAEQLIENLDAMIKGGWRTWS
jgi:hypothetical protein